MNPLKTIIVVDAIGKVSRLQPILGDSVRVCTPFSNPAGVRAKSIMWQVDDRVLLTEMTGDELRELKMKFEVCLVPDGVWL